MLIVLLCFRSNPTTLGLAIYFLVLDFGSVGSRAALKKEDAAMALRQCVGVGETCCFLSVPRKCSTPLWKQSTKF